MSSANFTNFTNNKSDYFWDFNNIRTLVAPGLQAASPGKSTGNTSSAVSGTPHMVDADESAR